MLAPILRSMVLSVFWVLFAVTAESTAADARPPEPIPRGKIEAGVFEASQVYPGTTRRYSVYVPAQYHRDRAAQLMVFMDGMNYAKPDGPFDATSVLDDLIHRGEIPVTIAVFVNPGTVPALKPGAADRSNRSFEYDSLGGRYATFLIDEFLPQVLDGLNVSDDPQRRAVCGISSGGICAFTVAWQRPDRFGKVISHIGSFTDIRGGWAYPGLVRQTKSAPKPIKIYLQEGRDDLNNLHGNWPLANQDLAAALAFAGYEHRLEMTAGGHSGIAGGERLTGAIRWLWAESETPPAVESLQTSPAWQPHPDAVPRDDVPQGRVIAMPPWESQIFANTIRDWSIYVPAQYDAATPAALMVFQDGDKFADGQRRWRVPVVFDNLIARGDMPPTIAVFINPGHDKSDPRPRGGKASNRGFEYDSLGDRYTRFLLEEILPEVERHYNLAADPAMRAIGGSSSGAICAFTVAWQRPDVFGKVYSNVGSFTHLRGGNVYPSWVRKTEPKPIRVYLADTSGDVDNAFGSWPWANRLMASALQYMGYDVRFDWAEGYGHNPDFGGSRFPAAMIWLWRQETHQPVLDTRGDLKGDLTLLRLLIPGETWEPVAEELGFADAACADAAGNFYFCDLREPAVYRINDRGERHKLAAVAVSGLMFAPDGRLYGCQGSQRRVVAIDAESGEVTTVAENLIPNDLAVDRDGRIYVTETQPGRILRIDPGVATAVMVDEANWRPNGIVLSRDEGTLAVSDYAGENVWTFRVLPDGSLDAKMPTMTMRLPIDPDGDFKFNQPPPYLSASRGDGMASDNAGRYYVTSALGIQIFDPTGRLCGVLPKPDPTQPLTNCILVAPRLAATDRAEPGLADPGYECLYVTHGDKVYRRRLTVR